MPVTTGDQFTEALRQLNTNSSEAARNVQGLGRVAVTKQITQTQRVVETVTENTVEKPKTGDDATTSIIIDVTDITQTSANAACLIQDLDGASGTCTLTNTATGTVLSTWPMAANHPMTGLTAATGYTLTLVGTAQYKNSDNSLTSVTVNQAKNFKTSTVVEPVPLNFVFNPSGVTIIQSPGTSVAECTIPPPNASGLCAVRFLIASDTFSFDPTYTITSWNIQYAGVSKLIGSGNPNSSTLMVSAQAYTGFFNQNITATIVITFSNGAVQTVQL